MARLSRNTSDDITVVKVALDPSPRQERRLWRAAEAARVAYDWTVSLVTWEMSVNWEGHGFRPFWDFYSTRKLFNRWKNVRYPWYLEVSKEAFASGIRDACQAFDSWYAHNETDHFFGFPRYRSQNDRTHSFGITTGAFGLPRDESDHKGIVIPKIGRVHAFENVRRRVGTGRVSSMRVTYDGYRWFASLTVIGGPKDVRRPRKGRGAVGIDMGCKSLVATSDGKTVPAPRFDRKNEGKVRRNRRRLSRKVGSKKGQRPSKRYRRQRRRLDKQTRHVRDQRDDFNMKLAQRLCRDYEVIAIEDLNVGGMAGRGGSRKRGLNRSIRDSSFAMLRDDLTLQGEKWGTTVVAVGRWFPSTKTCSSCGHVQGMSLGDRTFVCESCGSVIDRDVNAAMNILNEGLRILAGSTPVTARGGRKNPSREARTKRFPEGNVRLGVPVGNDRTSDCDGSEVFDTFGVT